MDYFNNVGRMMLDGKNNSYLQHAVSGVLS
ncbi:hypothetical protein SAMN05421882_10137 [Nitrosomonas communis]|uniref:Uncharacterized protein n=1 Tax=Nitrosomonas communis TaxID=44574 RepID=A0A1H2TWA1_9PROT|nr:hypothetical protein SAMN05421882_10137 [Nitrosomonas communis]